jgi:hypothetical protein
MSMISKWQVRVLISLLSAQKVSSNDAWANWLTRNLGKRLVAYKGEFSPRLSKNLDLLVGLLPFRNAAQVVFALNTNPSFDPRGLPNITSVARTAIQLYRLTEAFNKDRLDMVAEHLEKYKQESSR